MRRTAALATCAALAITFAACGDDDDDAAGDSTPVTADAGDAGAGEGSGDADPELVADCQAYVDATADLEAPEAPTIDEEISDETKDAAQQAIDASESIDLQSGELDDAIGQFVDALQAIVDGDTFTQEMQDNGIAAGEAIGTICAPLVEG